MPIGCVATIPEVITDINRTGGASRVLDLGIGNGMWGAALREWIHPQYIHGVEGFGEYRGPLWDMYDRVDVAEIHCRLCWMADKFDVVLMLDVIEHFEKPKGIEILALVAGILTPVGRLYVSTPAIWCEQGAENGNELERHRSLWTLADFTGAHVLRDGTRDCWGHEMLVVRLTAD